MRYDKPSALEEKRYDKSPVALSDSQAAELLLHYEIEGGPTLSKDGPAVLLGAPLSTWNKAEVTGIPNDASEFFFLGRVWKLVDDSFRDLDVNKASHLDTESPSVGNGNKVDTTQNLQSSTEQRSLDNVQPPPSPRITDSPYPSPRTASKRLLWKFGGGLPRSN